VQLVGAIHKPAPAGDGQGAPGDTPIELEIRTGGGYQISADVRARIETARVLDANQQETDDSRENGSQFTPSLPGGAGDLATPTDLVVVEGLTLRDQSDWYVFHTASEGDATTFVQIDFDQRRGDLDLALFQLDGGQLSEVRTEGLAFGDTARVSLLGLPAGTYVAQVFDDGGARNPYYALSVQPPGLLEPGIEATLGGFSLRDTSFLVRANTNLEFSAAVQGRLIVPFGIQAGVPTELAFAASVDNSGLAASLETGIGRDSVSIFRRVLPTQGTIDVELDPAQGGVIVFDFQSADDFKFAGLDAETGLWVIGR
jgi:hypothetical protein